jgi:hypothetical protein
LSRGGLQAGSPNGWCIQENGYPGTILEVLYPVASQGLGKGKANTTVMETTCQTLPGAASIAANYTSEGKQDWYLGNVTEYRTMFENLNGAYSETPIVQEYMWTSQAGYGESSNALVFYTVPPAEPHLQAGDMLDATVKVLPIRQF